MFRRMSTHRATGLAAIVTATSLVGVAACGIASSPAAGAMSGDVASRTMSTSGSVTAGASVAAAPQRAVTTRAKAGRDVRAVAVPKGAQGKVVYLTFDDGPDPRYTPAILSTLARYKARATFFMIGRSAKAHPALVRQVRAQGHTIGNHTFSHPWLTKKSAATVGSVAAGQHKKVIMWGVDTSDWSRPGTGRIVNSVMRGSKAGTIVLMHDGGGPRTQTVSALSTVLGQLSRKGYRFEPLPMCR